MRGTSWCVLQAPASAMLQDDEQTARTGPGRAEGVSGDPAQVTPGSRGDGGVSLQPPQVSTHIQVQAGLPA